MKILYYNPIKWLFGWKILEIAISVDTMDIKEANLRLKWKDLKGKLKKDVKIYVKPIEELYREYKTGSRKEGTSKSHMVDEEKVQEGVKSNFFSQASGIADYIILNEGKYDEWELEYAIKINEAFLEKYGAGNIDNPSHGSKIFLTYENLGYLYTKKGDYEKAIEYYEKAL